MTEESYTLKLSDTVSLLIDPKTSKVIGVAETNNKGATEPMNDVNSAVGIQLSAGSAIYAPILQSHLIIDKAKSETHNMVVAKGVPVTPGVHNGVEFTPEAVEQMAPMLLNKPVLIDHRFLDPSSIVGRVRSVRNEGPDIEVTVFIDDPKAQELIMSGEIGAFSIHVLAIVNETTMVMERPVRVVELTITPNPIDPRAVITSTAEVAVEVVLSNPSPNTGGTTMANEPKETPQAEAPVTAPPVPVQTVGELKMSETKENKAALEAKDLELAGTLQELSALRKEIQDERAERRYERTVQLANDLVKQSKIAPAAQDKLKDFMITLSKEQTKSLLEVLELNVPLPDKEDVGMVPDDEHKAGQQASKLSGMSQSDFDLLEKAHRVERLKNGGEPTELDDAALLKQYKRGPN